MKLRRAPPSLSVPQGELWAWGGTDHWWHEVEQDSWWQTHWRGDTTPRSSALLLASHKEEPAEEDAHDGGEMTQGEKDAEKLKTVRRRRARARARAETREGGESALSVRTAPAAAAAPAASGARRPGARGGGGESQPPPPPPPPPPLYPCLVLLARRC